MNQDRRCRFEFAYSELESGTAFAWDFGWEEIFGSVLLRRMNWILFRSSRAFERCTKKTVRKFPYSLYSVR